jgi:hypothetical protein
MKVMGKTSVSWGMRTPMGVAGQVLLVLVAAYVAALAIADNDSTKLILLGAVPVAIAVVLAVLNDWRRGFYAFVIWILFEDIIRKYMGNNMAIYFLKDILVIILYVSFFRPKSEKIEKFRPPFRMPLALFFWLSLIQVFNFASPSLLMGILGMKMNFLYVPLLYVGYAFAKTEKDVHRLFSLLSVLILIVAGLGLAQSIIGPSFLSPQTLQEDIRGAGTLYRSTSGGEMAYRPTSVFVSAGRFQNFLILSWVISLGYAACLLLRGVRKRTLAFVTVAVVGATSVMSTSRGVLMWDLGNSLVIGAACLWGAPWRRGETTRMLRAFQRAALLTGLAMICLAVVFPKELNSRLTVYSETLLPSSPTSELVARSHDYPLRQLKNAFEDPRWPIGNGTGTSGLGLQYLRRIFNLLPLPIGVESGMGNIVVELGILGLVFWLVLGLAITLSAWKVVKHLRGTPWFPLAFSIFLFGGLIFFPMTYVGMPYQDFLINSYLWLLTGILFSLYHLKQSPQESQAAATVQDIGVMPLPPVAPIVAAHRSG